MRHLKWMEPRRAFLGGSALRLALALPLVCVVVVGSLWLGQTLRAYRTPAESAPPSEEPASHAGATPAPTTHTPMQVINLPTGVAPAMGGVVAPSPDGTYLVGRTADFARLAIVRVIASDDQFYLRSELVTTLPLTFVTWMPDSKAFIAEGTTILNSIGKVQQKTYDLFRVDLGGVETKIGEVSTGGLALSPDAKQIAAFDGDARLIVIAVDGGGTRVVANDPTAGSAPAFLGWDSTGAIVRADYRAPFALHRIPPTGASTDVDLGGSATVSNARWSPDHKAALVTARIERPGSICECDRLLTDKVRDLQADALPAWVAPHTLLTRASDEHAGTIDVLTGARTAMKAKMRSENFRILSVSLPYVLWLDESTNVPHVLDLAKDRDTGVGLNPPPYAAYPLTRGRFLIAREAELVVLDMTAWFAQYVDAHPTPSPIPQSKDQAGVAAGMVRVESPEGGWSVVIPKAWYRRDAAMHGSEFLSYDPEGMDNSGNLPPAGQARVVLQLRNDYGAADLHAFVTGVGGVLYGGKVQSGTDTTLAGQSAYALVASGSGPPPWDAPLRYWFLRSPYFADRVVTIQATDALRSEVDALVASLRFFKPAPTATAKITKTDVIARYSQPTNSATRVDRVEAKLVKFKDFEKAMGGFRSGVNDPDELTWIVVVYGEIRPGGMIGPPSGLGQPTPSANATPVTFKYEIHAFNAVDDSLGGMYSCCGQDDRPAWFDTLVDLWK